MKESFEPHATSDIIEVGKELSDKLNEIRQSSINPESFRGMKYFTDEEIDSDLLYIEERERKFEERIQEQTPEQRIITENAEVIEVMLPLIIRDFDWLGKNTNIIATSRYDDITNGIDSVAQLMEPHEAWNIGMEIDFTSSEAEMMDKIKKIEHRIQEGKFSAVKYFDSPSTGKLKNVKMPKIAFGMHGRDMDNFVSLVADAYLSKNQTAAREELKHHKMKNRFIQLTANQLQEFGRVAAESGNIDNALLHHGVLERLRQRKLI